MMRKRDKELISIRDEVICSAWERYKNQISMDELAGFFNISLKSIYRIIAQKSGYPIKKKPTKKQIDNLIKIIRKS